MLVLMGPQRERRRWVDMSRGAVGGESGKEEESTFCKQAIKLLITYMQSI